MPYGVGLYLPRIPKENGGFVPLSRRLLSPGCAVYRHIRGLILHFISFDGQRKHRTARQEQQSQPQDEIAVVAGFG